MPNTKEIKERMKSVRDTQKITNAMYLIASMKMRKAKQDLDNTRPYMDAVASEIKRILRTQDHIDSKYFYPDENEPPLSGTYAMLVITADKGLAGAYNQNILKKAEETLKNHPAFKLFVVGEYGRQYFTRRHIPIEKNFLYTAQNPSIERAREINLELQKVYDSGEAEKIYVLYTNMKNGMVMEPVVYRLLPFHRSNFVSPTVEKKIKQPFEFVPSVEEAINGLVPSYMTGYIYSALVDSFCSEQNARMTAMSSANDNANEVLAQLGKEYNEIRQSVITQEITEVTSGAKALRRNRKEREA